MYLKHGLHHLFGHSMVCSKLQRSIDQLRLRLIELQYKVKLLTKGIHGGYDLSKDFPELGQSALYCFTEVHLKEDIDHLVHELGNVLTK